MLLIFNNINNVTKQSLINSYCTFDEIMKLHGIIILLFLENTLKLRLLWDLVVFLNYFSNSKQFEFKTIN